MKLTIFEKNSLLLTFWVKIKPFLHISADFLISSNFFKIFLHTVFHVFQCLWGIQRRFVLFLFQTGHEILSFVISFFHISFEDSQTSVLGTKMAGTIFCLCESEFFILWAVENLLLAGFGGIISVTDRWYSSQSFLFLQLLLLPNFWSAEVKFLQKFPKITPKLRV